VTEGGIFSASFITYKVNTTGAGIEFEVRRKDADFYFLRKHLLRCFPHIIIPPCPKDQPKLIAERIKRREKYYTRFLQAISRCEELKTNKFLLSFLAEKDLKTFQKVQKEHEKMKE
jgi:PX domain